MGAKSRGNWSVGFCMKTDCANRGDCDDCIRFSLYHPVNEDSEKDNMQ